MVSKKHPAKYMNDFTSHADCCEFCGPYSQCQLQLPHCLLVVADLKAPVSQSCSMTVLPLKPFLYYLWFIVKCALHDFENPTRPSKIQRDLLTDDLFTIIASTSLPTRQFIDKTEWGCQFENNHLNTYISTSKV